MKCLGGEDQAECGDFAGPGLESLTGDIDARKLSQVLSRNGSETGPGFQARHCVATSGQRQRRQAGTAAYLENSVASSDAGERNQVLKQLLGVSGAISVIEIPDFAEFEARAA